MSRKQKRGTPHAGIAPMNEPERLERICREAGAFSWGMVYPEDVDVNALKDRYASWMKENAGVLNYIDGRLDVLCDPFGARPEAKCALVISFAPVPDKCSKVFELPRAGADSVEVSVASYALEEDYHITGARILGNIASEIGVWNESCVDSKPVPEKEFAEIAGLGRCGMNTLVRLPGLGCRGHIGVLFLGERYELPEESAAVLMCEDCRACVAACPNGALDCKGNIIVRKCRSWIAGQKRGALLKNDQMALGNVLFGCSACSSSCPDDRGDIEDYMVDAEKLFFMSSAELRRIICGTVLEHTGVTVLKRNAAAAICRCKPEKAEYLLKAADSPAVKATIMEWI